MPRPARKTSTTRKIKTCKIKTCKIDVLVQSGLWEEPGKAKTTLRRAVRAAAAALSTTGAELAIVLTDDSAVRLLNRRPEVLFLFKTGEGASAPSPYSFV